MFLLPANMASFIKKLEKLWAEDKFVCIGLDPDYEKIPKSKSQITNSWNLALLVLVLVWILELGSCSTL